MNIVPAQQVRAVANADELVVRAWLNGRSHNTTVAYSADIRLFLSTMGRPLASTTLMDLQAFADGMDDVAQATRARRLASVKSLLTFAVKMGVMPINPGVALRVEKPTSAAAERILSEGEVARMVGGETAPRRRALLRLLYVCGLRVSEACSLRWRDLTGSAKKGGEARVLGKGSKLRKVAIPADLWRELEALSAAIRPETPVIPGRDGAALDRGAAWRAVKRAARRAGVTADASPHWMRHSHVSHALDNGCPVHVVQASVGHASLATTTAYAHLKPGASSASFIKG